MILSGYDSLSQAQKSTFSLIANKLLSYTFLARDKKDNKDLYYFVLSFKALFEEFFSILHYELKVDTALGTITLYSEENSSILRLKKDETIILFILRVLYQEKMKETTSNDNIVITVDDIHEKYNYLEIKRKINKTDLVTSLRLFRRYNLIETVGEIQRASAKIIILPTIVEAVNVSRINEVIEVIEKLAKEEAVS